MFAVPGWDVAPKSLVQEQSKPVKEKSKLPSSLSQLGNKHSAKSNKRKRDQDFEKQGPSVVGVTTTPPPAKESLQIKRSKSAAGSEGVDHSTNSRSRRNAHTNSLTATSAGPVGPIGAESNAKQQSVPLRKHQKEGMRKKDGTNGNQDVLHVTNRGADEDVKPRSLPPIPPAPTHLTPLQAKMRAKLTSARFRHLNETLYTTSSSDALKLFTNSPDLFAEYHAGFSQQVKESWPRNPVDVYINALKFRATISSPVNNTSLLPRRKPGVCAIADLGCGDAPLARGLQSVIKKLNLKLYNFDLHAPNSHVTVADISTLPLHDGEIDIAIFCLSLMGTNWLSFVEEAWRILRNDGKGEVWVAEVKSRFGRVAARRMPGRVVENSVGKRRKQQIGKQRSSEHADDEESQRLGENEVETAASGAEDDTDLQPFIDSIQRRGFFLKEGSIDRTNRMFVSMIFTKTGVPKAGKWKGMKWNGKNYQRIEDSSLRQRRKFPGGQKLHAAEEEIDEKEEAKSLKPCVYKLR